MNFFLLYNFHVESRNALYYDDYEEPKKKHDKQKFIKLSILYDFMQKLAAFLVIIYDIFFSKYDLNM